MNNARSAPVAVQLENGRVMVIGGLGETLSWMTPMNTPTFIDSTQVSGVIPFADLGQPPRTFSVFVYNPDGEDSNDVPFSVT